MTVTDTTIPTTISKFRTQLYDLFTSQTTDGSGEIDLTLPGRKVQVGHLHPITKVQQELEDIFIGLGFMIEDGPELESEYYNFDALNIPDYHPARDVQDTFFTTDGNLLLCASSFPDNR